MIARYSDESVRLYHGDCIEVMRQLPDDSMDAVVTDPPYALNFMGKKWDDFSGTTVGACEECGNDDPAEGYRYCTDCMEALDEAALRDSPMLGHQSQNWSEKATHSRGYADNNNAAFQRWCLLWATEALRVLKPGGHLLAFGGTRTWHRLSCAIEDAGFEVRDSIAWMYGSGFPKSLDVSKAMDKAAGAEREVVGTERNFGASKAEDGKQAYGDYAGEWKVTTPATDLARQWQGWGTALKPAFEPIVVARKPLIGTVAENVTRYGTGALNVDASRIGADQWEQGESLCDSCAGRAEQSARPATPATEASTATRLAAPTTSERASQVPRATSRTAIGCSDGTTAAGTSTSLSTDTSGELPTDQYPTGTSSTTSTTTRSTTASRTCNSCGARITRATTSGRWPSNVILDESQAEALDRQSGVSTSIGKAAFRPREVYNADAEGYSINGTEIGYGDTGGASRFFYTAKADSSERPRVDGVAHPTVKPLDLMRYLVRLVTPPNGVVLEPFAGSGTTAEACIIEGFRCIAIERESDYIPLILARITKPIEVTLL